MWKNFEWKCIAGDLIVYWEWIELWSVVSIWHVWVGGVKKRKPLKWKLLLHLDFWEYKKIGSGITWSDYSQ